MGRFNIQWYILIVIIIVVTECLKMVRNSKIIIFTQYFIIFDFRKSIKRGGTFVRIIIYPVSLSSISKEDMIIIKNGILIGSFILILVRPQHRKCSMFPFLRVFYHCLPNLIDSFR